MPGNAVVHFKSPSVAVPHLFIHLHSVRSVTPTRSKKHVVLTEDGPVPILVVDFMLEPRVRRLAIYLSLAALKKPLLWI